MDDTALAGKIVAAIKPFVAQPRGGAVGRPRHRAGARLAANDLDVKMIDRHRDQISGTAERTSERRISAPSLKKSREGLHRLKPSRRPYSIMPGARLSSPHRHGWRT